jgi:DNA polymerase-3 subunit delta'
VNDWGIIGHDWAVRRLQSAIASGQLAQSHLFVGPPSIGKAALAKATARALLGRDERTRALVDSMRHPDLAWVQPDGGDSIKVEAVRELLHTLTLAPVESRHRVAVIDQAQLVTDSGKNALLKTLEEPNPSVVIILIAPSVESVLPTISSRCQVLNLRTAPMQEIAAALEQRGTSPDQAAFIARLSRGRVGWALRASEDESALDERKQRIDGLIDLLSANSTKRFAYAEKLARADSEEIEATLNEWLLFWRDVTHAAADESHAALLNADYQSNIARIAASQDPVSASDMLRALTKTQQHVNRNVNARLALDVLLLKMPRIDQQVEERISG